MIHIRIRLRGNSGLFFCGVREFEPGKPRQTGGWRPATKNGCADCLAKFMESRVKVAKVRHKFPPGTFF
jgi:hypothetical protein